MEGSILQVNNQTYFISYTTRSENDVRWAVWIEYVLHEIVGAKTIMQEYDFRPGDNFKALMDDALKIADTVIGVLTDAYMNSYNCREEWTNTDRFIPVRCDDCEPVGLLKSRVYIDLYGLDKNAAREEFISKLQGKTRPDSEPDFPFASDGATPDNPTFPGFDINNLPDRNPYFAGREDMLSKVDAGLKDASTVITTGMGGLGKTQIAVEYAHRHATEYEYIWCFNAESEMRLQEDYREFAIRVVGLKNAREEDFTVVRSFIDDWCVNNSSYLFIYDNAEGCPDLRNYLPHGHLRGRILINSRERIPGIIGEKLDASVFTIPDAVAFLKKRIKSAKKADVKKLAIALGYLPLALEQAAVYINENRITIAYYLDLFHKNGLKVLNMLPDTGYDKTVPATLKITFDKIRQDEQSEPSLQLFKLLAYCAPDDIPFRMFVDGRDKIPQPLCDRLDPDDDAEHIALIRELTRYSLVSMRRDKDAGMLLSVHRLVQEAAIYDLDSKAEYLLYCLDVVREVFNYKYGTREDFESFALNMPHALEIARHAESNPASDNETKVNVARIYNKAGMGLEKRGEYAAALNWHKKDLAISEKVLGTEHPDTATAYNNIAGVYQDQGEYKTALDWYKKALATKEKVLGTKHPSTATTYNNIAGVYRDQGEYETALDWYMKALAIRKKVLGTEHPNTAATYNNIAGVYQDQGEYETALVWYKKALAIIEKLLGPAPEYSDDLQQHRGSIQLSGRVQNSLGLV
jgi:tetratricopeptide (TPR) repeat protein